MENVDWGIPVMRKKKEEKYTTPVVTMAELEKSGVARKFSFNAAAKEAMGITDKGTQYALVGFGKENNVFFKVQDEETDKGYKITKSGTFSHKKVFELIVDRLDLDTSKENEFDLIPRETVGEGVYEATLIVTDNVEIEDPKEAEMTEETVMSDAETQEVVEEKQAEKVEEVEEDWD